MSVCAMDAVTLERGPFKIVHHTTEGSTAAGAFATYRQTHDVPHFTVDDQFIYQHLDTEVAATALAHPPGTVETNKHSAVQFELIGFAGRPKNQASLKNVGRLCRWIENTHGVPAQWPNGYPNPPVNGRDPGHHNRDPHNWMTKGGHYGHCHVPVNVHWDPAYTAEEVAYVMSITASDGLELVEEKPMLPAMSSRASTPGTGPVRKAGVTKAERARAKKSKAKKTKAKKAKAKKAGKKRT
jgi:hypothetical protein